MKISDIKLKIIPDSRGEDTLEAELICGEEEVSDSVPSGKSTGSNEDFVLEPHKALEKFTVIKPLLLQKEFSDLAEFDKFLLGLDGTPNEQNLGGNLILALSLGFTKLLAKTDGLELFEEIAKISGTEIQKLPLCFFNLIEGGVHAVSSLPFQEYLFVPQTDSPKESLSEVMLVIKNLGEKIHRQFGHLVQGDEGGYAIPSGDPMLGLQVLYEVAGHSNSRLGLDAAASTFYHDGIYKIGNAVVSHDQMMELYKKAVVDFNLLSIEDPFSENDWKGFTEITGELGDKVWIVGDDLTTTNPERIKVAKEKNAINALIVKPNQIGSVTETIKAANLAKSYGWKIIVSHRSGETMDTFIADLAVGLGADGLKAGCPLQEVRLAKYQRLVEIEQRWHT